MPEPKPGTLHNLRIKRVAVVDMGANFDKVTGDGAHIMLFKSATTKNPGVGAVHVDSTEWESEYEKANLDAASRNKLPDSAFAAVWTDDKGKHRKLPIHDAGHLAAARGRIDQADIPANVKADARRKIDAATKTKEKAVKKNLFQRMMKAVGMTDPVARAAELEEINKAFPDDNDADDKAVHKADDPMCKCADCMAKSVAKHAEEIKKAAGELVAAEIAKANTQITELRKQNDTLSAQVAVEIEKREDEEIRTVLKSFKATAVNLDTDVAIFRKMHKSDSAMYDRTIAIMKAQDAIAAKSGAFTNLGSGLEGGLDAWGQLEAKADAVVEKSAKPMTREQALEKVMLDPRNNSLVKAYRAAQQ